MTKHVRRAEQHFNAATYPISAVVLSQKSQAEVPPRAEAPCRCGEMVPPRCRCPMAELDTLPTWLVRLKAVPF